MKAYIKKEVAQKHMFIKGLNITLLASAIGVNVSYLNQILNENKSVGPRIAKSIARGLGIKVEDLVSFEYKEELKMNKKDLTETIEYMYKSALNNRPNEILEVLASEATTEQVELLNGFHPKQVTMIEKDDEYFCGARAEHFVVMTGYCENLSPDFGDEAIYIHRDKDGVGYIHDAVLILANHKGLLHYTLFRTPPLKTLDLNQ